MEITTEQISQVLDEAVESGARFIGGMRSVGDTGKKQLQKISEIDLPEMSDNLRRELISVLRLAAVYELKTDKGLSSLLFSPRSDAWQENIDIYIDIPEIEKMKKILDEKMPDPPPEAAEPAEEEAEEERWQATHR